MFLLDFSLWCSPNNLCNFKSNIVLHLFNLITEAFIVRLFINKKGVRECLGKICFSFWINAMPLLALKDFSLKCWKKFSLLSSYIPRCFWQLVCATGAISKLTVGWFVFLNLCEKITSCASLFRSRLKEIFQWFWSDSYSKSLQTNVCVNSVSSWRK